MGEVERFRVIIECEPHEEDFFGDLRRGARTHIFGEMQLRLCHGARVVALVTDDVAAVQAVVTECAPRGATMTITGDHPG